MKAIVLEPDCICVPTPFAKQPNSLENDVDHTCAMGPRLNCLYSSDAPFSGSMTELMTCVHRCSRMERTSVAIA